MSKELALGDVQSIAHKNSVLVDIVVGSLPVCFAVIVVGLSAYANRILLPAKSGRLEKADAPALSQHLTAGGLRDASWKVCRSHRFLLIFPALRHPFEMGAPKLAMILRVLYHAIPLATAIKWNHSGPMMGL
jgi:hypothetical protein